jgi:hypothetical protein
MAVTSQVEPITDAVHLSIDAQDIFARGGIGKRRGWNAAAGVVEIGARHPARTVFTRFITPMHADDRPGRWRRYFRKWHRVTRAELPASELELVLRSGGLSLRQKSSTSRRIKRGTLSTHHGG